jgi:transposase
MRYVKKISDQDKLILEQMKRNNASYIARARAHAVLLSNEGMEVQELSMIFSVCRQTASKWLKAWETGGVDALIDKPRSGRPSTELNARERTQQNSL